jgi:hypothetical protein
MNVELMASARRSVLEQLALAHDHWAEEEQRLVGEGRYIESQGAHEIAVSLLRAYRAELDDPKPRKAAA